MNNNYKVFPTTDGKFAICEYTQINPRIGIWSPVNTNRWETEGRAQFELKSITVWGTSSAAPVARRVEPPKKNIFHTTDVKRDPRSSFRYTKLQKGVVVVEQFQDWKWQTVTTKKSVTKAEEYINEHSL